MSRYRDASNVKILLSKLHKPPSVLVTNHMPAYNAAVELFFPQIELLQVGLGGNNTVETRFSLFKDFYRAKRGFKKFRNIPLYVNGFCVIHNLYKLEGEGYYAMVAKLISFITTT